MLLALAKSISYKHTQRSWCLKPSDSFAISGYSTIFTSERVDNA